MNATPDTFQEARERQWTWKTSAMSAMAVAVCRLAIEKAGEEFSANDLHLEHGGSGICGSIFKRLAKDEVIASVGGFIGGEFMQKFVKNEGGNRIGVWKLKSYSRALALIEEHGSAEPQLKQAELIGN